MNRARDVVANVLVGVVILLVVVWLLRRVLGFVLGVASLVLLVIAVVALLAVADRIRSGKKRPRL